MKDNSYLESYKIQVVRRIFAGESMKTISDELHIAKSTLWGWKCKYGSLVSNEMEIEEDNKKRFVFGGAGVSATIMLSQKACNLLYCGDGSETNYVNVAALDIRYR